MKVEVSRYVAKAIKDLIPSEIAGVKLFAGSFGEVDKKVLIDAASEIIRNKAACVLMSSGERLFLVIASDQSLDVDCPKMLNAALSSVNGKGGGKRNFATGGAASSERADDVMILAITNMRAALEAQ